MGIISKNESESAAQPSAEGAIYTRVLRTMALATALAVLISFAVAPWRVTTGFLLGGILSLLSHHWMRTSISAAFGRALGSGTKPQLTSMKYVLRYFVVAAAVFTAYNLGVVSLPATFAGLCSFVVALFVEAFREFYFAIIHREETS